MSVPAQPFVEPPWMTNSGGVTALAKYDRNFSSSAAANDNGAKAPTSGQTFPTGR